KLGRELAQIDVPTVLIVPDPNHHLSNTCKDICKIEYFTDGIGKMRTTITYFSHSIYSATHLKALRVIREVNKGLEKVDKTRFGTMYWASYAHLRCLPGISELIATGIIDDKSKLAWFKRMREFHTFELELQQLCSILEPIARAINRDGHGSGSGYETTTVGDIWKFYVAITAVLHDLFKENTLSVPLDVQQEVCGIVNRRYNEMIHGPSGDLFLSRFFLDPGKFILLLNYLC
ncbi:hypothetical protein B0H10DRAFT_1818977, partial [Mycena sp. CBHHK59/15]